MIISQIISILKLTSNKSVGDHCSSSLFLAFTQIPSFVMKEVKKPKRSVLALDSIKRQSKSSHLGRVLFKSLFKLNTQQIVFAPQ